MRKLLLGTTALAAAATLSANAALADIFVMDAFATRREVSIEEARQILLKGLVLHYDDALIRYNLGCYACVLKSFGECIDFLKEAVRRDERFKLMALEDEDLLEVREALLKLGWAQVVV